MRIQPSETMSLPAGADDGEILIFLISRGDPRCAYSSFVSFEVDFARHSGLFVNGVNNADARCPLPASAGVTKLFRLGVANLNVCQQLRAQLRCQCVVLKLNGVEIRVLDDSPRCSGLGCRLGFFNMACFAFRLCDGCIVDKHHGR